MALVSWHRATEATKRAFDSGPGTRRLELITLTGGLALCVIAARSIPTLHGHVPKPLFLVLGLAGVAVLLTISAEQLFLGWLFLAPLLQESADKTRLGHLLSLTLYTAPPVIFGAKVLLDRGWRPRREWYDFVPAIYTAFILGSIAVTDSSALKSGTIGTLRGFYQTVALGPLVYYVVAFWRGRPLPLVRISWILLVTASIQAMMTVIESRTGWNLWGDTSWQHGDVRSIGTLANPAVTGAFIGVGIVVALAILCWAGPPNLRRLAIFMLIVGLPGLYMTKTRGPILATLVAGGLCLLLSARSRLVGVAVVSLAALTLVAFWPQIKASPAYQNRFNQRQNVDARLILQHVSIKLAEAKPILGWGYDSFDRVKFTVQTSYGGIALEQALQSTSHDTFLTILVEFGVVGLILFVVPWAAVLWRALRRARPPSPDRWFYVAGIGGIAVITIDAGTLDFRFFSFLPALAWMFLGLLRRQLATEEPPGTPLPAASSS